MKSEAEIDKKKYLIYEKYGIKTVSIAGDWNEWTAEKNFLEEKKPGLFIYAVANIPPGKHFYKFIIDGRWEGGDNKVLYINERSEIYNPKSEVRYAYIDDLNSIRLIINSDTNALKNAKFSFNNNIQIKNIKIEPDNECKYLRGYSIEGNKIKFWFKESVYTLDIPNTAEVEVAGNFNDWANSLSTNRWQLKDEDNDDIWMFETDIEKVKINEQELIFKFVMNNENWLQGPIGAPNIINDESGNKNLSIKLNFTGGSIVYIETSKINLSKSNKITISNLSEQPITVELTPSDKLFNTHFISDKKLGAFFDESQQSTIFRIFSPRAEKVTLYLYNSNEDTKAYSSLNLVKDDSGVWEAFEIGKLEGKYYKYSIKGPQGEGEGFDENWLLSDLYATANVNHTGKSILLNADIIDGVFTGWTDTNFQTPSKKDLIIYEASVRDLTADESSNVPVRLRGKYLGLVDTIGKATGIDHLKETGINVIEFLPVHEFDDNPPGTYHWGYMSTLYFAPESSYSTNPEKGKQVTEFKKLVNELHSNNIAVLMDVVYNHTGQPNYYRGYDNKYYYRLNDDFGYINFSGCGNDFKTENYMSRRLIIDSLKHFVIHYHIDGFRFDLAELIDLPTLLEIEKELKKIKPDIILIAEPWSFRGSLKGKLKNTSWASWNDDFRNKVKDFAKGNISNIDELKSVITGSTKLWTTAPLESVNYVESHDDKTLTDDLSTRDDHNGSILNDVERKMNRLCATILFTSAGMPMISGGQEILRSKYGNPNSYNAGDTINSIKWDFKSKNNIEYNYYKGLINLRNSSIGEIIKFTGTNPDSYYQWLIGSNNKSIGYFLNADKSQKNRRMLVLLNADNLQNSTFSISFQEGEWQLISDGDKINLSGIDNTKFALNFSYTLSPVSSAIFLEK